MCGLIADWKKNRQEKRKQINEKLELFREDIKNKMWGESLKNYVKDRYSDIYGRIIDFNNLNYRNMVGFYDIIYKEWGVYINKKDASWAWDKIRAEILWELDEPRREAKRREEERISKKKLQEDTNYKSFPTALISYVKRNNGLWENKKENTKTKFISLLQSCYPGLHFNEKNASDIWDNICKIIAKGVSLEDEIKKLGSSESSIRISGANNLGNLKDRRAVRPLLEALKDPELEVQVASAKALSEIGDPRALTDIRKLDNKISNKITKINKEISRIHTKKLDRYNVANDLAMRRSRTDSLRLEISFLSDVRTVLSEAMDKLNKIKFNQMAKVTENNLREMNWQDFQDKIIETLDGIPSDKKAADMGIDGMTSSGVPIQVKQSENVGRNVVDNFETALRRYHPASKKIKKGIIVAFSFTKGAYDEAQRAHLEDKIKIDLVTVEELIE